MNLDKNGLKINNNTEIFTPKKPEFRYKPGNSHAWNKQTNKTKKQKSKKQKNLYNTRQLLPVTPTPEKQM